MKLYSFNPADVISTETFDTKQLRKTILATYKDLTEYAAVMVAEVPQRLKHRLWDKNERGCLDGQPLLFKKKYEKYFYIFEK